MHRKTARDAYYLTGNKVSVITGHESDNTGKIVGLPKSLKGNGTLQPVIELLSILALTDKRLEKGRVRRTRTYNIKSDILPSTLPS